MTGRKYDFANDLTESEKPATAVMITTMLAQEANVADLWNLDVVGITDSIEKVGKSLRDEQIREFLAKTVKWTDDGR